MDAQWSLSQFPEVQLFDWLFVIFVGVVQLFPLSVDWEKYRSPFDQPFTDVSANVNRVHWVNKFPFISMPRLILAIFKSQAEGKAHSNARSISSIPVADDQWKKAQES